MQEEAERRLEKLEEITRRQQTINQNDAAELLGVTPSHVSNLIRQNKIDADKTRRPYKPYLKSVLEYKTNPNMKRMGPRKKTKV